MLTLRPFFNWRCYIDNIRILQAQTKVPENKEQLNGILDELCRTAAEENADMLTLPEMFCCPYDTSLFPVYAEPEDGQLHSLCASSARKYGIYLSAGTVPEIEDGKIYNTAYVFDRNGNQIAKHRKMHMFDIDIRNGQAFRESDTLSPGSSITVFDSEFGKIGLCVCFDFRFPELGRIMALNGARLVLCPAAFNSTTGPAHWELMFRAESMFNQYFTIGTAPALDTAASYHSWGHSIAVDPWGKVIRQMGMEAGIQLVDLDLSMTESVRSQLPLLFNRRSDVYSLIVL